MTMSRGLGGLQRQILESLDVARDAQESYDRGWVLHQCVDMRLREDVYDLRVVAVYVARQRRYPYGQRATFSPMFSRAVHGLVQRGLLTPVTFVPLTEVVVRPGGHDWFISYMGEDPVFHWRSRSARDHPTAERRRLLVSLHRSAPKATGSQAQI
jgi:hypothetical protein